MRPKASLAVGVCLFLGFAVPVVAFENIAGPRAASIQFGAKTALPLGYFSLCKTGSSVCRTGKNGRNLIDWNRATQGKLSAVNRAVNHGMKVKVDRSDRWSVGVRAGDCEDFALTKKKKLMAAGLPAGALLIALAKTARGEDHAVLVVRTEKGDFVLDNLSETVVPWRPSLYTWKSIQSPKNTWEWYSIS